MVNSSGLPVCVAGSCSVVGILMGLSGALVGWLVARSGAVSLWNGSGNTSKPLQNKGFRNSCTQRIRDAYTKHMATNLNKKQTNRALVIWRELMTIAPDMVTAREASDLCSRYNITNDKFRRVASARQNFQGFNLITVAVEIAKKESK